MQILEDLWYGNICPNDDMRHFEQGYANLLNLCDRNQSALMATLNAEQKVLLDKLVDLWTDIQMENQSAAFAIGFRLAVQLMTASVCTLPE